MKLKEGDKVDVKFIDNNSQWKGTIKGKYVIWKKGGRNQLSTLLAWANDPFHVIVKKVR